MPTPPDARSPVLTAPRVSSALILITLALGPIGFALTVDQTSYDIWGVFWVAPVMLLLSLPFASHAARVTGDRSIAQIFMLGAMLKVVGGACARYWGEVAIYGGSDAAGYHNAGEALGPLLRQGIYSDLGKISGTRFTEVLTGQVYALVGPTRLGGYVIFSWLAFVGLCLFWHAFRVAFPDGDHKRYLKLLMFFPSMLFWTSGTGKEAWMILCLGAASYGFAHLMAGHARGAVALALGLWGGAVMRPHIPLIVVVAVAVALLGNLLMKRRGDKVLARRGGAALLIVALGLVATLVIGTAESFFELDRLDVESAETVTEQVQTNTQTGGSAFDAPDPGTPWGFAAAVGTVLFRPHLAEATGTQGVVSSMEGLLLVGLLIQSRGRLRRLPRELLRSPYLLFCVAYLCAFVFAFASIENFGILVRQRTQLLPLLFVLISFVPPTGPRGDRARAHDAFESGLLREAPVPAGSVVGGEAPSS